MIEYCMINGFDCGVLYSNRKESNNIIIGIAVKHKHVAEPLETFHFIEHSLISTWYTEYCNKNNISIDARTSIEHTQYIISFPKSSELLLLAIDLANSIIQGYFIHQNDFERIREDILYEYNLVCSQPRFQIEYEMVRKKTGLSSIPIGTLEKIKTVEFKDTLECFNKYYTSKNIFIVVLGIDPLWKIHLGNIGAELTYIKNLEKEDNGCPFRSLFDTQANRKGVVELYQSPQYSPYEFKYFDYIPEFKNRTMDEIFANLFLLVLEETISTKLKLEFEDILFDIIEITSSCKMIRISKRVSLQVDFNEIVLEIKQLSNYKAIIRKSLSYAVQLTKHQLASSSTFTKEQTQIYLEAFVAGYVPYSAEDMLKLLVDTPSKTWEAAIYSCVKRCFKEAEND